MKKWSEIKQATLDKLFLDESEAEQQGYKAKFQYLANECLDIIANGVKPQIKKFEYSSVDRDEEVEMPEDFLSFADLTNYAIIDLVKRVRLMPIPTYNLVNTKVHYMGETDENYTHNSYYVCQRLAENSYAWVETISEHNSCRKENPELVYLTDNMIRLKEVGDYTIYYNARYGEITKEKIEEDAILDIPNSILNCLPTYMASQLLRQDDIQQSTVLKNEFELMLSRLDTDMMIQEKHFKSVGGWY